jgi:hypothetical protein
VASFFFILLLLQVTRDVLNEAIDALNGTRYYS